MNEIEAHIKNSSAKSYSEFYIGITNDVERRLFNEHNVDKNHEWWIYREAIDEINSRAVEKHFLGKGMKGGNGGGDETSVYVYCYKISDSTKE